MQKLPLKGFATYDPDFLGETEATRLFHEILDGYEVTCKQMRMFDGTEHIAETGSYIFTDEDLTSYDCLPEVWGGRSPWPESLAAIRDRIHADTGVHFRVARCIYYRDGSEGVDFHRDLPAYGDTSEIASLSLGAEREFRMRLCEDHSDVYPIRLEPGSLLFMGKGCQEYYEHALPHDETCLEPRLNLTFRKYGWD